MISAEEFLSRHAATSPGASASMDASSADASDNGVVTGECSVARECGVPAECGMSAEHGGPARYGMPAGGAHDGVHRGMHGDARKRDGNRGTHASRQVSMKRRSRHGGFAFVPAADGMDRQACMDTALRLLDASSRSTGAMRERLGERGFEAEVIESVMDRLAELGYMDDAAVGRSLMRSCLHKHMGEQGVRHTLLRKGVARSCVDAVIAQGRDEGLFEQSAWELGQTVAAKTRGMERQARLRRFWSAGARKGHGSADLRRVADELFAA
ncbi:regulatory protein RecX [Bifidobacterium gallicum]|nr:regulatory protein RecX [Bifidobacterium gallicum]